MTTTRDVIIVGGGVVGSAIALGLVRSGLRSAVLDGADQDERASRANFGLVWGQSKGDTLPQYALWTREAIHLWPEFEDQLLNETGVSCQFRGNGGLHICLSEAELADRRALFERMDAIGGDRPLELEILDRKQAAELMPGLGLGAEVVGAGYCKQDGHLSPHSMLAAIQRGILFHGSTIHPNRHVTGITRQGQTWTVACQAETFEAPILVLAAGTGNKALGQMVGVDIPVFAMKGQILVSERVAPRMELPTHKVRQTEAGSFLLGDSKEPDAGHDDRSNATIIHEIAERALRMFPWLAEINMMRTWGGIRSMTADSFPIYDIYPDHPGLFTANCHSGVTLAPVHAMRLAPVIASMKVTPQVAAMSARRFDVQAH